MSHTPGPWFVEQTDGIYVCHSGTVCPVTTVAEVGLYYGEKVALANAQLAAASPTLLKELAHLVRLLEPELEAGRLQVPGLATLNGAKAAISKATDVQGGER